MSTPLQAIRNVAIVAHVDHGKTTLVDAMFHFAGTFRANQDVRERVLDSDAQERERGITILAKNTAIDYCGTRVNIVDTPGHADFGGQVERTLTMADAVLLLVDAFEGPMPQTRFVLRKAFEAGLKALVMINKADRTDQRSQAVLEEIFDLFVDLGANDGQLDFPIVYGSGRDGWAVTDMEDDRRDLTPLLDLILNSVPAPLRAVDAPLRFQASTLEYDDFLGRVAVGRVDRGALGIGQRHVLCHPDREGVTPAIVKSLFRYEGLERVPVEEVLAGDIAVLAGIEEIRLGDSLCDLEHPEPLPAIAVDEPTISMVFQVNNSPFAGRDGRYVTSRHLAARLERAALRDPALIVEPGMTADAFIVKGRGVMHLSVLMENMRREEYEFAVGKPHVIIKEVDGVQCEPWESATVEVPKESAGRVIEYLGGRRGELTHMDALGNLSKLDFMVPARGLISARTSLLTLSQGEAVLSHVFDSWRADGGPIPRRTGGVLVADRQGGVVPYALDGLSDRGFFFVGPGEEVYEGMLVGEQNHEGDLPVNVCRTRKLTNIRSSTKEDSVRISPPRPLSLEESLEYIEDDELLEVTPATIRMRKRVLNTDIRQKQARSRQPR